MRRLVVGTTLFMLACGAPKAWDMKGAPKTLPDEQYRTGHEAGSDVWVWHCVGNERVVITQYSSAFCGANAPQIQRGPCGAPLAFEVNVGMRYGPIPEGYRWPGSPPPPPWPAEEGPDAAGDASSDARSDGAKD
jgi:hypothetical protein